MSKTILETDTEGALRLTREQLGDVGAHARFVVEREGDKIVLRPAGGASRWDSSTPEERAEEFRRWALSHRGGPAYLMRPSRGRVSTTDDGLPAGH
jgi:hypothetical protein